MLVVRALLVVPFFVLALLAARVEPGRSASAASPPPTRSLAVSPIASAVATVLLQTVVGGFKDEAISAGFGSLLSFIGLDGEPPATAAQVEQIDARVKRVEEALQQVTATVGETKRNVDQSRLDLATIKDSTLRSEYSRSADSATAVVLQIDTALRKIAAANGAPVGAAGDRTRHDAESYVSEYIDGAAERLQAAVFGDPRGIGGTPLAQTAFGVATSNDFLTHGESVHIRYLVDLYTTYEALAAAITGEYRSYRAGYRDADVKAYLEGWITTAKAQQAMRRDAVPQATAVDARTLRMWSLAGGRTRSPASSDAVTGPAYSDWAIPSIATYQALVAGYVRTPVEFLRNHGFDMQANVVISNERKDYTACRPGFVSLDLAASPPALGTAYGADLGGCKPGTHAGATTYQTCKNVRAGKGSVVKRCTTHTDEQQVTYNARQFGSNHLYFAVRNVPVGSFLPSAYVGTP